LILILIFLSITSDKLKTVSLLTVQLERIYAVYSDGFHWLAKQSWSVLGPSATYRCGTNTQRLSSKSFVMFLQWLF